LCHGVCVDEDLWDAYDRMGVSFEQHAADSAYNAHYDRPAVLAALGPVTGHQVLDAACGPGLYLRELLERGAKVTAFDASPVMVRLARQQAVSTQHPVMDWLRKGGSYFQTTLETDLWHTPAGDQPVHFWREPLSALCTAATGAGFFIEKLIEPMPAETMRERYPEDYEQLSKEPGFLILRLLKPATPKPSPPD